MSDLPANEHPAYGLARKMARERDGRFEQLRRAEAERDRYARALVTIKRTSDDPWVRTEAQNALTPTSASAPQGRTAYVPAGAFCTFHANQRHEMQAISRKQPDV